MNETTMKDQVRTVIIRTFGLAGNEDTNNLRLGSVPRWDSMGHMQLIPEVENAFGVTFPAYALAELVDVDSIVRAIQQYKVDR